MLLMLTACGGGGGGGTTPPANIIPNAVAGGDQQVTEGDSVTLDGTASSDADGTINGYAWLQISGTSVGSLNDAGEGKVSFTAPNGDHDLTFRLTVTDNDSANDTDTVNVAVSAQSVSNLAPTANAGDDVSADEGDAVSLDGRASSDSDGTIDYYQWSLFSKDTGESDPVLTDATSAEATATLPGAMAVDTVYTYKLTVTDNLGATNSDYVDIIANANPVAGQTVSGSIAIPPGSRVDIDTLDPHDTLVPDNDTIGTAQSMPNPAVIGGYSSNPDFGNPDD
ncbi:PKD domain-containing protein [Solemya elarraichensis gill symbiont]|nr:PKD domain-containing protein [Solemya elarraichensis gill symbiont]